MLVGRGGPGPLGGFSTSPSLTGRVARASGEGGIFLGLSASLSSTWGETPPLVSGGRRCSTCQPRPRSLAALRAPGERRSALQPLPRPLARGEGSAARLFSPALARLRMRRGAPLGSSAPPSPTCEWGGERHSALQPRPRPLVVGKGGAARLFSLHHLPMGWGGTVRVRRCSLSASLSPAWRGDAAWPFGLALARLPMGGRCCSALVPALPSLNGRSGRARASGEVTQFSAFRPRSGSHPREGRHCSALQPRPRPFASGEGRRPPAALQPLPSPTCQWGGEAPLGSSASESPSPTLGEALIGLSGPTLSRWPRRLFSH